MNNSRKNIVIQYIITIFASLAVIYPLFVYLKTAEWALDSTFILTLFPIFGLIAFSILWLHSLSGVFETWLRKYINFDRYVHITASIVLICIISHPLLYIIAAKFSISTIFYGQALYIWLGIIGWLLLITYDIGKSLKNRNFFARNWTNILFLSNIGFIIIFFHSIYIGDDLQVNPLRMIWIFYGITAIISIAYTYVIKRFLLRSRSS